MGMIGTMLQVSKSELESYISNPALFENRIYAENFFDDPNVLDLDKLWEGMFYMLTGQALSGIDLVKEPLVWFLLSDKSIDEKQDLGYGPASYIEAEEVKKLYKELDKISDEEFRKRFKPKEMMALGIYPQIWTDGAFILEELFDCFNEIVLFYEKAARKEYAVVTFIS
jgi:hypothetical protein